MNEELRIVIDKLGAMYDAFLRTLPKLIIALVVLVVAWLIARYLSRGLVKIVARTKLRESLVDLFARLVSVSIGAVGFLVAATIVFPNLTVGKLVTVLGLSSVAIGFAFKDVFENFLAGIVVLVRDVIEHGDYVQVGDTVGKVEKITIRDSHLRTVDGKRVIVPNATLFKNQVTVLTDAPTRRTTVICGVAYDEDIDEARAVIKKAVESCETVTHRRPVEIFAREFGASSIDFEVTWWAGATPLEERRSRDEVISAVKRALDDAGIEIPFPYRTITFKGPGPELIRGEQEAEVPA